MFHSNTYKSDHLAFSFLINLIIATEKGMKTPKVFAFILLVCIVCFQIGSQYNIPGTFKLEIYIVILNKAKAGKCEKEKENAKDEEEKKKKLKKNKKTR